MGKKLALFKQLIARKVSIEHIEKTAIKRTPGAVTEESRN
jgi:hypothetical protein